MAQNQQKSELARQDEAMKAEALIPKDEKGVPVDRLSDIKFVNCNKDVSATLNKLLKEVLGEGKFALTVHNLESKQLPLSISIRLENDALAASSSSKPTKRPG